MSQLTNGDITLLFSAHRVLQVCRSLTKHCILATAYENVVKHLKLAIRQMEQLTKMETEIDEDEVCDLMS